MATWSFLTNHAHVIFCLADDPDARLRDVAEAVGITERAAQRIVGELATSGYLTIDRVGRRNHYTVHPALELRHPIEAHCTLGQLISLIVPGGGDG